MLGAGAVLLDHQDARACALPASRCAAAERARARRSPRADCAVTAGESLPSGHIVCCSVAFSPRRAAPRRARSSAASMRVVDRVDDDDAVLRRAAGRVVERLRAHDQFGRARDVGALVDDHRDVAGADAERRRAARVGGAHVGLRAGRDDEVALPHQLVRRLLAHRRRQQLHQVARRADAVELRVDELDQLRARSTSPSATARR